MASLSLRESGGRSFAEARSGAIIGTLDFAVLLEVIAFAPGVPETVSDLFPEETIDDTTASPSLVFAYPETETLFPRNLEGVLYQWSALNLDVFELRFEGLDSVYRYFTNDTRFPLSGPAHVAVGLSNAGQSVNVHIRGTSETENAEVYRDSISVEFSDSDIPAIAYYSSRQTGRVRRIDLQATTSEDFYPQSGDAVSLLAMSPSADVMLVRSGGNALLVDVTTQNVIFEDYLQREDGGETEIEDLDAERGSIDPTGGWLLISHEGDLESVATENAAQIDRVTGAFHPTFSPDGRWLTTAYAPGESFSDDDLFETQIARYNFSVGGVFGEPQVLVASSTPSATLHSPSVSPDGQWVAYVRSEGRSDDNPLSEIYVAPANGNGPETLLQRLNRGAEGVVFSDVTNIEPRWLSSTEPGLFWIVFSSARSHGNERSSTGPTDLHLWMAAIRSDQLSSADGSFPSFYLPGQNTGGGNERLFFASPR